MSFPMPITKYIDFPVFDFPIDDIPLRLNEILTSHRAKLKEILTEKKFTWKNLIHPLEMMSVRLHRFWSIVSHLNAVKNSPELRNIYTPCLLEINKYETNLLHNLDLYKAIKSLHRTQSKNLNAAQKAVLKQYLLDFKLAGAELTSAKKKAWQKLSNELAELQNKFSENLLDATHAWNKHITDSKLLEGMPAYALSAAKKRAQDKKQVGFLLTLMVQ
jgi:oligopeptidase A